MRKNRFLIFVILGLFINWGCNKQGQDFGSGILKGRVSIGPLCPVETDPPNPNCQPTEETYKAWPVAVFTEDGKKQITELQPNLDGSYELELSAGFYQVELKNRQSTWPGVSNLPVSIEIYTADTTYLDINIDTGIR